MDASTSHQSPLMDRMSETSTPDPGQQDFPTTQLTPRSKVKAMLAALDDDSDAEAAITSGPFHGRSHVASASASEDRESDEQPIAPRGKLAARLNRRSSQSPEARKSESSGSDKENAYARVKRQMMKRPRTPPVEKSTARNKVVKHSAPVTPSEQVEAGIHSRTSSPTPSRGISPGLFLTPSSGKEQPQHMQSSTKYQQYSQGNDTSDRDLPENPVKSNKTLELVARKRAEREAREAEAAAKKSKYRREEVDSDDSASSLDSEEKEIGKRLTQSDRPTRKASKKALEEMNRETQRMSRNMQLAHQAKTKKKITKDSLLARFNFTANSGASNGPLSSDQASSAPASDHEGAIPKETPPTSPMEPSETGISLVKQMSMTTDTALDQPQEATASTHEDELPDMTDLLNQPASRNEEEKMEAPGNDGAQSGNERRLPKVFDFEKRPIKVRSLHQLSFHRREDSSDSELEVLPAKSKVGRLAAFDRVPQVKAQDVRSLQTLRALAHLNSPPDKKGQKGKFSGSFMDMQNSLQKKARMQAVAERRAKIEDLKARGIMIQTEEERQQEQVEVEDLLEKARRENQEIRDKEKRAARKEKLANGESGDLDDSSDDEDYQDGQSQEGADVDFSGSDNEEGLIEQDQDGSQQDEDNDEGVEIGKPNEELELRRKAHGLIEDEASEDSLDDEDVDADDEDDDDHALATDSPVRRNRRNRTVLEDDDDERPETDSLDVYTTKPTQSSNVEVPSMFQDQENSNPIGMTQAFAATMADTQSQAPSTSFEIPDMFRKNAKDVPMGMTQAFAATIAESQTQADKNDSEMQDFLPTLDGPPEPRIPVLCVEDSFKLVDDTQNDTRIPETSDSHKMDLHLSQSQLDYEAMDEDERTQRATATQWSEIPDPTQDAGFVMSSPALENRFVSEPPSTVDTVIVASPTGGGSPLMKKRGRLQRGRIIKPLSDELNSNGATHASQRIQEGSNDAFAAMKQARRHAAQKEAYNKKKSEAKEMVEEQAQESEDEYAGLGGASEDESGGEEDELVNAMIDQGDVDVDERKLAAYHADKQRADDGKAIEKLFKDINNGGFRRKRGADFDLSDSDDDAEARRRRKQREFAKMRKALLENENVGKIAEDPRKMAFLKAIEDRDDDQDLDFLDRPAEDTFCVEMDTQQEGESQSQLKASAEGPKLDTDKHPSGYDKAAMRPPATSRRTVPTASKKPATLKEIRDSVSFLIEEPGSFNMNTEDPSSSADEDAGEEAQIPPLHKNDTPGDTNISNMQPSKNPRRTTSNSIIDRLVLKRQQSSSASSLASTTSLAFQAAGAPASAITFVPSLLRRAGTSNLSALSNTDANGISHTTAAATERAAGGGDKEGFVKRGGTKRSSVNFAMREREKRSVVEDVERRKRDEREKLRARRQDGGGVVGMLSRGSTWEE